jgi:hypothetical protein
MAFIQLMKAATASSPFPLYPHHKFPRFFPYLSRSTYEINLLSLSATIVLTYAMPDQSN